MPLEFEQIAGAVVAVLAPMSPFIAEGAKGFAAKAGEAGWDQAQRIWEFLTKGRTRIDLTPEMKALARNTESKNYRGALAETLTAHLTANPDVASNLVELLRQHPRIQTLLADNGSIEDAVQRMSSSGAQYIEARNGGSIRGARQEM